MAELTQTELTRLERAKDRGSYDQDLIHSVLDDTPLCHIGYQVDGQPLVMPTCHWRVDDHVYWHGSRISRTMLQTEQQSTCLTVTHMDGFVLARSAFHHSANYRSVMVFGQPTLVAQDDLKLHVLQRFIDHWFSDRWDALRPVSRKELDATTVLSLPISQASAKVRSGPPIDLAEDEQWPVWAGVLPMRTQVDEPVNCPLSLPDIPVPSHVQRFREKVNRHE